MEKSIKRSFILGDEWIYYKIYTGVKSADFILMKHLKPLLEELVDNLDVDQWFFIRYSDPDFHLRLRLHISDRSKLAHIINSVNIELKLLLELELIWKVQIDTYNRELERYGFSIIEQSESMFYYDSKMIIDALEIIENNDNSNLKWLWGLMVIDTFMDDFSFSIMEKKDLMENLKISFAKEMAVDKNLRKQLSAKYQKFKTEIDAFINKRVEHEMLCILLKKKSAYISNEIAVIKNCKSESLNINYLISSHIHMIMNRLFRTKNRQNEFVSYQMLYFHYETRIARIKYDKNLPKNTAYVYTLEHSKHLNS
jgi:thiopeptide-type bacteriocin biosynthesis protein